jgi:pimeloyl-ACP methyl ester carboxylesterase
MNLKTTTLSQGKVSYRLIGEGSRKILFFHGFPGSSSQIALFQNSVKEQDIQVLCFDRPGYNETFAPTKDMLSETLQASIELTRQIGWSRFEIVTVSGGTPYGLSLAQKFSDHVTAVRVICGMGYIQDPSIKKYFNRVQLFSLRLLRYVPGAWLRKVVAPKKQLTKKKRSQFVEFFYPTSESDREIIQQRNLAGNLNLTLVEAVSQNAAGPIADSKVFLSDWGAELETFKIPVAFWHGDADRVIPYQVSELMAALIPNAKVSLIPKEGHISLPVRRASEILAAPLI